MWKCEPGKRDAETVKLAVVDELAGPSNGGQALHGAGDSEGVDDCRR